MRKYIVTGIAGLQLWVICENISYLARYWKDYQSLLYWAVVSLLLCFIVFFIYFGKLAMREWFGVTHDHFEIRTKEGVLSGEDIGISDAGDSLMIIHGAIKSFVFTSKVLSVTVWKGGKSDTMRVKKFIDLYFEKENK